MRGLLVTLSVLALAGCGGAAPKGGDKPAKVEPVAHESELMKITLSPEAERRLGIAVAAAGSASGEATLATFGEVVIPPSAAGGLPITATTDLALLAANQARAEGDVARAAAQAQAAQLNLRRAEALVREEAGSAKARDDARAAALASQADLATARAQRGILGPAVSSLGHRGTYWVRVAMLAADMGRVVRGAPARITPLGRDDAALTGRPVPAPPSANSAAGSVDLYFSVPNRGLQLGQRVTVTLPAIGPQAATGLAVPSSAIVYDIHGGEWVYRRVADRSYERKRVQVARIEGGTALIAGGLTPADRVVTAGAAELFGTEFGTK